MIVETRWVRANIASARLSCPGATTVETFGRVSDGQEIPPASSLNIAGAIKQPEVRIYTLVTIRAII